MSDKNISIVLPVFNEASILEELLNRLDKLANNLLAYKIEFIFVNDGSIDNSYEILVRKARADSRFKLIDFSRNFGQQIAISAGIEHANGDAIIVMDSDLQDPPEFIPEMIKKWEQGYDVVYAIRRTRKDKMLKKILAKIFYRILNKISQVPIPKDSGDFSLIDKKIKKEIISFKERSKYIRGIRAWVGFKQIGLEYDRDNRFAGKPTYSFRSSLKLAEDAIISFSDLPLKLPFYIGILGLASSIVIIVYLIYKFILEGIFVNKWVYVIAAIFIMININFIIWGIFSLYFSKLISEINGRPLYIVKQKINF